MKILIPLLSETENEAAFLEKATEGADNVILLVVVDASPKEKFGFTASFIQKARSVMEEVKETLAKKKKPCEDVMEWGDTQSKIVNLSRLKKADKVVLKKQDNHYFRQLVKKLEEEKIKTEIV